MARRVPYLFKVPKGETPNLFKFISSCEFKFDPFSPKARAVREVWRELSSSKFATANPKAKIELNLVRDQASILGMTFIDGTQRDFSADEVSAKELLADIFNVASTIEFEYMKDNKPLP